MNCRRFKVPVARFYAAEVLLYLNSYNGTIYGEPKPENVLLDTNGHLLLAFFLKTQFQKSFFVENTQFQKFFFAENTQFQKSIFAENTQFQKSIFAENTQFQKSIFAENTQFQKSIFAENYEHFGTASQLNNLSCRLHFVYMQRASKHPSFSSLWHSYPHCAKSNVQGPKHHTGTHVTQQRSPRVRAFLLFSHLLLAFFLKIHNSKNPKIQNPKVQKSKNPKVQKSKNPKVQKSKNPKVQKSKNPKVQKSKNPKVQKSKNPKVQKSKNPKVQKSKNPKSIFAENYEHFGTGK
ncbi:hypothetical protein Glove_564g60 [Diversispora epigaea]|uniref:Protein kinase domain-containing protein n=1 Tax=Diversispora epigaea TaxID=1348612 RepID=A0A397GIS2_9GLOM|nr:hypothetical protein Glove_564g60 [Diversispora epigaea]